MWNSSTWETQQLCIKHVLHRLRCYSGLTTFSFSIYTKCYLLCLFKPTERTFRSWTHWLLEPRKSFRCARERERECELMTERWTEGAFFKNRPSQTHTPGLVQTPALSQKQGQAGCTSQSQHYSSEQSINKDKQRNRKKWDRKRHRGRRGREMRNGKKRGSRKAI